MTCRIERRVIKEDQDDLVILSISGEITDHDLDTFRVSLEKERGVVAINLEEVLLVDREGIRFLASCESCGVQLRNCPAYIQEWVRSERADLNAQE